MRSAPSTSVTCEARDNSGNIGYGKFPVTVQDTTPPTMILPNPPPTVTIPCPSPYRVASMTVLSAQNIVKVQQTPPPPPSSQCPNSANVTFTVSATDIVDGSVPVDCDRLSGSMFQIGRTTVSCTATDRSGNQAKGNFTATVHQGGSQSNVSPPADTTPPLIEAIIDGIEGSNGWYTGDVDVGWIVNDSESQISSRSEACDQTTTINQDTTVNGQTITCEATSQGGTATQSITIKRDATDPSIDWTSEISNGNVFDEEQVPSEPTCEAGDAQSGMEGECEVSGYSTEVGEHTITIAARDIAGNQITEIISYTVIQEEDNVNDNNGGGDEVDNGGGDEVDNGGGDEVDNGGGDEVDNGGGV
jgi:hypothetical protein